MSYVYEKANYEVHQYRGHLIHEYEHFVEVFNSTLKKSKYFDDLSKARSWIYNGWLNSDYVSF